MTDLWNEILVEAQLCVEQFTLHHSTIESCYIISLFNALDLQIYSFKLLSAINGHVNSWYSSFVHCEKFLSAVSIFEISTKSVSNWKTIVLNNGVVRVLGISSVHQNTLCAEKRHSLTTEPFERVGLSLQSLWDIIERLWYICLLSLSLVKWWKGEEVRSP